MKSVNQESKEPSAGMRVAGGGPLELVHCQIPTGVEEPTIPSSKSTTVGLDIVPVCRGTLTDNLAQAGFHEVGGVLEDLMERRKLHEDSCRGRESFEKRTRTRGGAIFTLHVSLGLRADVGPLYPVLDLKTFGGYARGGLDERETSSLAVERVTKNLDVSLNEGSTNLAREMGNDGEDVRGGKGNQSEGQGEPSEGAPECRGNSGEARRGKDRAGNDVLDLRPQQQQQQQRQKRKDKKEEGGEEEGGGTEGGTTSKDSSGNGCSLEGLRVALARHGITRNRRQIFRRGAAEFGMEARDWPPPQEAKTPNSLDLMPGVAARLSPPFRCPKTKRLARSGSRSAIRGKGKKRLRDCGSRREGSVSQIPGDSTAATIAPCPLAPMEKATAAATAATPHGKYEGDHGKSSISNNPDGGGSSSSSSKSGSGCQEERSNGWVWPVERLRREGFTHVVCAPSNVSRTALWDELVILDSEGGPEGGNRASESGSVEVVGVDWLVSCLGEKRRVPTEPYLLAPPTPVSHAVSGGGFGISGSGDISDDGAQKGENTCSEKQQAELQGTLTPLKVATYACQRPTPMNHHNKHVTDVLDATSKLYKVVGDNQRSDSYQRASSVLKSLPRRIRSAREVAHANRIGKQLARNIDEIIETGTLQRLEELRQNPKNAVCMELTKVHGVGPETALAWYRAGVRGVEDARRKLDAQGERANLPFLKAEVVMGLRYFQDLQVLLESEEVLSIAKDVREEAERVGRERDPEGKVLFEVCGGFRRGKEKCHDVDILVSFQRGNGDSGHVPFLEGIKERLVESGKLFATLSQGRMGGFGEKSDAFVSNLEREEVLMGMWQLPGRKCRVDIVQVALPVWPFAVLGWSGSVMFERDLRRYAKEVMTMRLTKHGLSFADSGLPVPGTFKTEEEIFSRLGLDYIPPHLRCA